MRSRLTLVFCIVLAIGVLLRLGFFWVSVTHVPPSFDESIAMLGAKAILQDGAALSMQAKQHPRMLLGRFPLLMLAQPYLFPLEAYLKAPFVPLLPTNAFGARIIGFILGLLCAGLTLWVTIRTYGISGGWPGWILILLPSSYFLTLQVAYSLPGYPAILLLSGLLIWLAFLHAQCEDAGVRSVILAGAAGLTAGLACSVTLMALPLLLAFGVMVGLGRRWQQLATSLPGYVMGAGLGFIPYVLAKRLYPGAHAAVAGRHAWDAAIKRLLSPAIDYTLPCAMGVEPVVFPDGRTLPWVPGASRWFGYMLLAILVLASAVCLWRFVLRAWRERWARIELTDVMVAICWMAIVLFIVSRRSHSHTYRYMLLVAWALPVLVAGLAAQGGRWLRRLLGLCALPFAALSVAGTVFLMRLWADEGFAARELYFFDLQPAIEQLDALGIDRCYATALFSYRINYETDERILCSQPYNERFPGWPYPYKDIVSMSTNVAYVLAPGYRYLPHFFEGDLRRMGVTCSETNVGPYSIYWDFKQKVTPRDRLLPPDDVRVAVSHFPEQAAALSDGSYTRRWRSHGAQQPGMYVELTFPTPVQPRRLRLYYNGYHHDRARSLDILAEHDGAWVPVKEGVTGDLEPFEFRNGLPYYGNTPHTIRLGRVAPTERLRIVVREPDPGRDWTIGEICVYVRDV